MLEASSQEVLSTEAALPNNSGAVSRIHGSNVKPLLELLFADPETTATRGRVVAFEPRAPFPCIFALPEGFDVPLQLTLANPQAAYQFQVQRLERRQDAWATALPDEVAILRRRAERRISCPPGVSARLAGIPCELRDLSLGGVGLFAERAFPPAMQDLRLEIDWPPNEGLVLAGRVVRSRRKGREDGLSLHLDPADAEKWRRALDHVLYPNTRWGRTWAAASWALYEHSGYFMLSEKKPHHFAYLKGAFARSCRKLDAVPALGGQVSWPSVRGVEASLSVLRIHETCAMIYQVARRRDGIPPGSGRQMLREINLHAFETLQRDPSLKWILILVQDDGAPWSRLAYRAFGEALGAKRASVRPFRALEVRTAQRLKGLPDGARVEDGSPGEIAILLDCLERSRDPIYCEALDLRRDQLQLSRLKPRWKAGGLNRDRGVRILSHRGEPVAAAILELADQGLHLFGLLDVARLFPLRHGAEAFFPYLLEDARRWFSAHERPSFVCLAEDLQLPTPPGIQDLGSARQIIFSTEDLPLFLEHLHRITMAQPRRDAA